jgi:hypothetical protein
MSREVRMVPPDWQHPTEWGKDWRTGQPKLRHVALLDGDYDEAASEWDREAAQWEAGYVRDYFNRGYKAKDETHEGSYAEWAGDRPNPGHYMPKFAPETATHLMMYETTSEGTPISPAFATPEELARWLADNNASAFGSDGATYEQWLRVCRGGFAPTAVGTSAGLLSGVAGLTTT